MSKIRTRAQTHFPTVLLTLISIIQALALELMWSKIIDSDWLLVLDFQALIGLGHGDRLVLGNTADMGDVLDDSYGFYLAAPTQRFHCAFYNWHSTIHVDRTNW